MKIAAPTSNPSFCAIALLLGFLTDDIVIAWKDEDLNTAGLNRS